MGKKADAAPKPRGKSSGPSNHGGPRPGSGRKPKAITELKAALISEPLENKGPVEPGEKATAADYAFRLFAREMQDAGRPIDLRLDCAREVMNRAWGKPRQAVEVSGKDGAPIKAYIGFDPDDV